MITKYRWYFFFIGAIITAYGLHLNAQNTTWYAMGLLIGAIGILGIVDAGQEE